jgi:hypothetical protein
MNHSINSKASRTIDDSRKIGKWAHVYAQNRTLGVVAFQLIFIVYFLAIIGASYFGGMAYRAGYWPICGLCMAILVMSILGTVYLSVPQWGGRMVERCIKRLYADEGNALITPACTVGRKRLVKIMGALLGGGVAVSFVLGLFEIIPIQYMQPISAIYVVPFLLTLLIVMRPAVGPIMFLWPALYTLHAALILAGAPILFVGRWDILNMLIPTLGYGLLAGLIAHVYSRFALWKIRHIARNSLQNETMEGRQS